jgi:hypothetical protein
MNDLTKISDEMLLDLKRSVDVEIKSRKEDGRMNTNRFKAMQHNNTSGVKGVTFNKSAGKWQAKIGDGKGKAKHLGYFKTIDLAVIARAEAEGKMWGLRQ